MVSLKDWFPYLPKMIFINYVSSYQCWVISNFFKNPLIQVFKKFTRLTSNFFLNSKKYFHPSFKVLNFTHFKPIGVQRQFLQTNFQKLSYFKLVIFVFLTLKNYTKMWRAKKQKQQNQKRCQQTKEQKLQNQERC